MRAVSLTLVMALIVSPAFAHKEDPDTEVARRHFEAARRYYDAADYQNALEAFERAKRVKPAAAFDFNIGRCLDRLERYEEAVTAYARYVSSSPTPDDADEVRARIATLNQRIATAPKPKPPDKTLQPEPLAPLPPSLQVPSALPPGPPKLDPEQERRRKNRRTAAIVASVIVGSLLVGGAVAAGLLIKTTTEPNTQSTLGTWSGTN